MTATLVFVLCSRGNNNRPSFWLLVVLELHPEQHPGPKNRKYGAKCNNSPRYWYQCFGSGSFSWKHGSGSEINRLPDICVTLTVFLLFKEEKKNGNLISTCTQHTTMSFKFLLIYIYIYYKCGKVWIFSVRLLPPRHTLLLLPRPRLRWWAQRSTLSLAPGQSSAGSTPTNCLVYTSQVYLTCLLFLMFTMQPL